MPSRLFSAVLLCVLALLLTSARGFAPGSSSKPSFGTTTSQRSSIHEELPSWVELPKASLPNNNVRSEAGVMTVEIIAGRVAMVSAVILIGGEVLTGHSVVEQWADALKNILT